MAALSPTIVLFLHVAGLVLTAGLSVAAAVWIHRRTADRAGTYLIAILLTTCVMAVLSIFALLVSTQPWHRFLSGTIFAFVWLVQPLWFLFAVSFTGRTYWLTPPVWALMVTLALVPAAFAATDVVHGLYFVDFRIVADPLPYGRYRLSSVAKLLFVPMAVFIAGTVWLFVKQFTFTGRESRWQLLSILVGMGCIIASSSLSATDLVPIPRFPYGVFGAGTFALLVTVSLFRTRLFAVAPLARNDLFDAVDDGIIVVDADHRVADYNDRAGQAFPALTESHGVALGDVYPEFFEEAGSSVPDPIESTSETVQAPFAETIQIGEGSDGHSYRVRTSAIASGGEPRGYALLVRDVTELEAYAAELERRNAQLDRFASVLSHDLRNPLSVATGYVQLEQDERESDHLRTAQRALGRIEETISDLLTLARDGSAITETTPVSLAAIADDAWQTSEVGEAAFENDVPTAVRISADRSRLQTMLENLFRNATEHGGSTVRVGLLGDRETDSETGFYVADDGSGVDPDDRDAIFEYGYSTAEDGTGFGLAIVTSVAEAHGWTVDVVESAQGGARFRILDAEFVDLPDGTASASGSSSDQ